MQDEAIHKLPVKGWQHGGQRTRRSHIVTATHHYNSNKED